WIQPDCNLPSGESFVRQGLYAQRYFKARFNVTATVGYNVDSFGHAATLPQLLRGCGMDAYVFMRPVPHEKGLPAPLFWWEAPDGSRVLTYRLPHTYGPPRTDLGPHVRNCAAALRREREQGLCFFGVGNHGGGPTRANLESIRSLMDDPEGPTLVWSSPEQFFESVRDHAEAIPTVRDELQHHAMGCYAAHSGVKRWNRRAENLLATAEKLSVIARDVAGQPYPRNLDRAWKDVLFNQFHDILAGTSIESAYEDARDLYGEALTIASRALNNAVQRLSWRVGTEMEEGATPVVVFNPHSWPATVPVELEYGSLRPTDHLLDDGDHEVPLQAIRSEATVTGGRSRICFLADLPALGYRLYRVVPGTEERTAPPELAEHELENEYLRLQVDPTTGYITSLLDKVAGQEVFRGSAAIPEVFSDPTDTWSHGITRYGESAGVFKATSVRRTEHGPVRSVLQVCAEYGQSRLTQDFVMYAGLPGVEVRVTVDWRERFKLLKLRFPVALFSTTTTYEAPYGHVERESVGDEEPMQSWVDISGIGANTQEMYGLSLLNDGKYSLSARHNELLLTALRSPIYAHHVPFVPDPNGDYTFTDQGVQRFTYTMLPHRGTWRDAVTVRRALELNQPPVALVETYHPGPLPPSASYLSVTPANVVVGALKKAEDNDDIILRVVETHGVRTQAHVRLGAWDRELDTELGPSEVKTFRVPADPSMPVTETNLLEWER
ncbi:MAG: glycosyl hydrolase-related protein, partial [Chloroflexota bacterium]|nr:glycosyl hydrolase-related protein [Chloroflexota bacterium]